jgi:hypothetical protein
VQDAREYFLTGILRDFELVLRFGDMLVEDRLVEARKKVERCQEYLKG